MFGRFKRVEQNGSRQPLANFNSNRNTGILFDYLCKRIAVFVDKIFSLKMSEKWTKSGYKLSLMEHLKSLYA